MHVKDRLGDFVLVRELGRGGMGVVYLARQESLGRMVAVKVLPFELTSDPVRLSRFRREAEVVSRLDHPSIIPVYDVGSSDGIHFIVMKYLRGQSVDDEIRARRKELGPGACSPGSDAPGVPTTMILPRSERVPDVQQRARPFGLPRIDRAAPSESDVGRVFRCMRVGERVAMALHHAHQSEIIHRDVKPGNIMLDDKGDPCLLDFGLVRDLSSDDNTLTASGGMVGTAYYMAPEQVRQGSGELDHRVDIYSLGVTLYEMVTLTRPFPYDTPDQLFHAIVNEEPLPPRRINASLPRDLETVILKAMDKDPQRRYQTAEEFAADLRRVRSFEPIVARPTGLVGRMRKWIRRNPVLAGAYLFALLSFLGMLEYSIYRHKVDRKRAAHALQTADRAYESGNHSDALTQYRLYLSLGGDRRLVSPRFEELEVIMREQQQLVRERSDQKR